MEEGKIRINIMYTHFQFCRTYRSHVYFLMRSGICAFLILISTCHVCAQSDEFLPGPDIQVEGIPRIPKSLVSEVNKYNYSFGWPVVGWNDSGNEIMLKNKSGGFSLYIASVPGRIPRNWLRHKESFVYDIYPDPQKRYFVYNKDSKGDEVFQMYLFDSESKQSTLLSDGLSRDTEPVWSRSGKKFAFSCSKKGEMGVSLCLMEPLVKKLIRPLVKTTGNYFVTQDWSPDDNNIVYCEFYSNTLSRIWLKNMRTGKTEALTNHTRSDQAYYDSVQFSQDGNGLYFITDRQGEYRRPAYMDIKTRKMSYLINDIDWDVEKLLMSPDGANLALVFNVNGISKLYLYNVKDRKYSLIDMAEEGLITNLSWNPQSTFLAFNFTSYKTPGDVRVLDVAGLKIDLWLKGFTGNLSVNEWSAPELISWKSFDGRIITGYMYRPPAKFIGKRPVIIDIHGGPEDQYRPSFGYSENYIISEMGIVKIYPNIRGSVGFGKTFLDLDNGKLRINAVKDVGALINWIKNQQDMDTSRILVQGASYGGYVSLSAATLYGSDIKAVIAESMPANLATFIATTKEWRRPIQRLEYGDERQEQMKLFMNRTSPVSHIKKLSSPVFIIHGGNDVRAPISEAEIVIKEVKKNNIPLWQLIAINEGHDFINSHTWLFRLCSVMQFVKMNLMVDLNQNEKETK